MGMRGGNPMSLMHSLRRDQSVTKEKLPPGTIKRIFRFASPYRAMLILFLVLIVADALISAANPLLYREIIDRGVIGKDVHIVIVVAFVVGALAVGDAIVTIGQRYISARIGEGLIYDMRVRVFDHIDSMPLAFFTRTQTGALVSRLNNDVLGAQSAFTNTFSSVIGNILTVGVTLVAMFILSWQITLLALVMLPVFLFPARFVGRRLARITRDGYNLNAIMSSTMTERFNVAGALLVKLYGRQGAEEETFARRAGEVRDIGILQSMYAGVFFVSLLLTASLATALVYGVGGVFAAHGEIQVGTVVALTAYLTRLYGPLTALSNVQVDVMTALVSFDRVFEVLDLEPLVANRPGAVTLDRGPTRVTFEHVDFSYPTADEVSLASLESVAVLETAPRTQILFDIDFDVPPGSLTALVGPSGAGKTTISHLVPRLYDAKAGTVRINGIDVRDATLDSVHDVVGVVTQDAHLFHETIRSNLAYAKPDATDAELWAALEQAQIAPLVATLPDGLDTLVGDRGYRLSGGEKQRIAIARLLLKAPDVVVLDEATAHLDSESEAAVQEALATALVGRTSIVIAHRLSTVRSADQILVIDSGHIAERGTHEELIALDGVYAELYHTQFADQDDDAPRLQP
jgi:ATP-binding cassette subfamily B protein